MTDMQKAQVLHQVTRLFNMPEPALEALLQQIKDESIRSNFARISRGLTVEENYRHFSSAMPWVKNINGIDQQQEQAHKKEYQAPDYSLLVEDSKNGRFNVYVDVKSIKGAKESCEIPPKQKHALMNYARDHKVPLLLAIYWERLGYWTHNVVSHLSGKKGNKLTWQEAIKNDVSHIFGDYTFVVAMPFYRQTTFHSRESNGSARHEKYGYFTSVLVGNRLDRMTEYSVIESSAIDSMFRARETNCTKENDSFVVTEVFAERPMLVKISNWLVNFLSTWKFDPSEAVNEEKVIEVGRKLMVNLMQDLGYKPTYSIPASKNRDTDLLYQLAYEGTDVLRDYNASLK
jgi:hypothetical protein